MQLILASKSKGRQHLMSACGLSFKVVVSDYVEDHELTSDPISLVKSLAINKARSVKANNAIIIAADTMVLVGNKLLGKPKSFDEAFNQLRTLSGRVHRLITGLAVINSVTDEEVIDYAVTELKFRELSDDEIENYLGLIDYKSVAGSYLIDGPAMLFTEWINGSFSNIIGLPMNKLAVILKRMGVNVFKKV